MVKLLCLFFFHRLKVKTFVILQEIYSPSRGKEDNLRLNLQYKKRWAPKMFDLTCILEEVDTKKLVINL